MHKSNCPSTLTTNEGQPQNITLHRVTKPLNKVKTKTLGSCPHCGFQFRLNVVADRKSGIKYLRTGCCDAALRTCPNPNDLLKSPHLTDDERDFLARVEPLAWFSGAVAGVLLEIEARLSNVIDADMTADILGDLLPSTEVDQ